MSAENSDNIRPIRPDVSPIQEAKQSFGPKADVRLEKVSRRMRATQAVYGFTEEVLLEIESSFIAYLNPILLNDDTSFESQTEDRIWELYSPFIESVEERLTPKNAEEEVEPITLEEKEQFMAMISEEDDSGVFPFHPDPQINRMLLDARMVRSNAERKALQATITFWEEVKSVFLKYSESGSDQIQIIDEKIEGLKKKLGSESSQDAE